MFISNELIVLGSKTDFYIYIICLKCLNTSLSLLVIFPLHLAPRKSIFKELVEILIMIILIIVIIIIMLIIIIIHNVFGY